MVSVYDELSRAWSANSTLSKQIDIKINVTLKHTFFVNNTVQISWEQTGKFKNYQLSRFKAKLWIGDNETPTDYMITDHIIKCMLMIIN